jgi:PAS domain S-box-containing protein
MAKEIPFQISNLKSEIGNPQSLRVLMVDDSEDDVLLIIHELKKGGYNPLYERVETADAMKKSLQETQWDVILCDYKMPKFNAPSAIALLKETNIDIPIIIISRTIGEETAIECMRLGAHDYFMKANLSRLCSAIARELEESEGRNKQRQAESQREAALEALRQSEEKYRNILKDVEDAYYEVDFAGNLTFFNDSLCLLYGYSKEELMNMNYRQYTDKETGQKVFQAFNKVYKTGEPIKEFNWQAVRKNGAKIYVELSISLKKDSSGNSTGFKGIIRDITERKKAEEELNELVLIIRNSSELISLSTLDGNMIFINEAGSEMLGIFSNEVKQINIMQVIPVHLKNMVEKELLPALLNTGRWSGDLQLLNIKTGQVRDFHSTAFVIKDLETGMPLYLANVSINITERKKAESQREAALEKSRESEERYKALFDRSLDLVYIIDFEGRFIDANDAALNRLGYKRKEITSLNIVSILDEDQIPLALEIVREIRETGVQKEAAEIKLRHKDGTDVYVETQGSVVISNGKPVAIQAIARDTTERRQAEKELLFLTRRLNDIIEFIPDATFVINQEKKITAWNRAIEEMSGIKKEVMLGRGDYEYALPFFGRRRPILIDLVDKSELDKSDKEIYTLYKYVERGNKIYAESYIPTLYGGKGAHLWHVAAPLFDRDGNRFGSIEVIRDVTDIKAKEESLKESLRSKEVAEAATKAKSEFLATMSHEIRTPMNGIIGLVNLAIQTDLTEKQRDYLTKIETSAQNLLTIINDILDFSKIEADKMNLEILDFNLEDVLINVSGLTYPSAAEKGLELFFHIGDLVPLHLEGDPLRLQQILMNLTSNAVKFTDKGEVVIRVDLYDKFKSGEKDYTRLRFSVRDTGIGLTEEQIKKLFQLFTQADGSITRRYGGTGLGLAISKRLVQLMGGEIDVSSKIGKGSTFTFLIPFGIGKKREEFDSTATTDKKIEMADRVVHDADKKFLMAQLGGNRVLLVDDNFINQQIAREILEQAKIKVVVAVNGKDALNKINQELFDLVLMDIQMPEMDGYKATEIIRQDQRFKAIPIIAMTAQAMSGDKEKCLAAGMNDYIAKPINASAFYLTLSRWLKPKAGVIKQDEAL